MKCNIEEQNKFKGEMITFNFYVNVKASISAKMTHGKSILNKDFSQAVFCTVESKHFILSTLKSTNESLNMCFIFKTVNIFFKLN